MFFRALGPIRVVVAAGQLGQPLPQDVDLYFPGRRQQTILAMLMVGVGQTISTDRMIDAIWDDSMPPATARAQVQNCTAAVRRALEQAQHQRQSSMGRQVTIATRPQGYRLDADPEATDIGRFERMVRDCLRSSAERNEKVIAALREGLSLWTGPALGGLPTRELRAEADRLEELRLVAMEELACRELELGTAPELQVAELIALTRRHPGRERPRLLLMDALHRCGRTGEALVRYREYREWLLSEHGVEPGPEIRAKQRTILEDSA